MRSCRWRVRSAPFLGDLDAALPSPSMVLSKPLPGEIEFKTQILIQEVWREAHMSAFLTSSLGNWPAHPQPLEGQGFQIPGPIRVQTLIPLACGRGKPVFFGFCSFLLLGQFVFSSRIGNHCGRQSREESARPQRWN